MLQQQQPEDYVIVTGEQPSVREFVEAATGEVGIELRREGSGVDEKGYDPGGRYKLAVDLRYFCPTEVETLLGDPSKAREKLALAAPGRFSGAGGGNGAGGFQGRRAGCAGRASWLLGL